MLQKDALETVPSPILWAWLKYISAPKGYQFYKNTLTDNDNSRAIKMPT